MNHDDWPGDDDLLVPAAGCLAVAILLSVACVAGLLRIVWVVIELMTQ